MVDEQHSDVERVTVWQCIGCGKIEAPRPCIGVCEDHRVEMVYAFEHDAAMAEAERAGHHAAALEAFVRRFAFTRPRDGQWENSYRAMQEQARRVLSALAAGDANDLLRATAATDDASGGAVTRQR